MDIIDIRRILMRWLGSTVKLQFYQNDIVKARRDSDGQLSFYQFGKNQLCPIHGRPTLT